MLYLIIIASCCTSLGVKKKQIIVGQWNCWNWCLELLWRSVCLTEPLFKCCISFLHVAPDAKNCLSFCNELLTRFWEPFNICFSNFTEVCTNPNIHFLLILTNVVGRFLYFTGNQSFSGFAIFNIKENHLVWVYSIFSENKTRQFQGRLEFSENKTNQFHGRLEFSWSRAPGSMVFWSL